MSAVIEIDTLSLEGLTEAQSAEAARVFELELAALLERHGLPPGVRAEDAARIDIDALPRTATTPQGVGRELARALYSVLATEGRP